MIAAAFWQTNNKNTGGGGGGIAPVITTNITGSIVNTFPTTITIVVTGNPTPVFSWTKDGIPIVGETGPSISVNSVGSYAVTVSNPNGTVNSNTSIIYYSPDPVYHINFIYYNASQCNLSNVATPIISGYVDPGDASSILTFQNGNYTVNTTVFTTNYILNKTVMTETFRDACVGNSYNGDTTIVFSLTRNYYNAIYNEETEQYECKTPPEFGTIYRTVSLSDLANSIKIQYDQSIITPPIIPLGSSGNPFTYTLADS